MPLVPCHCSEVVSRLVSERLLPLVKPAVPHRNESVGAIVLDDLFFCKHIVLQSTIVYSWFIHSIHDIRYGTFYGFLWVDRCSCLSHDFGVLSRERRFFQCQDLTYSRTRRSQWRMLKWPIFLLDHIFEPGCIEFACEPFHRHGEQHVHRRKVILYVFWKVSKTYCLLQWFVWQWTDAERKLRAPQGFVAGRVTIGFLKRESFGWLQWTSTWPLVLADLVPRPQTTTKKLAA